VAAFIHELESHFGEKKPKDGAKLEQFTRQDCTGTIRATRFALRIAATSFLSH
jgi:hypothetical protein